MAAAIAAASSMVGSGVIRMLGEELLTTECFRACDAEVLRAWT
ncbi:unannotated protein [freshwater metagenome]|uniref:Unannotated protein n=1 Tax=freshwater metagenome TaxID=449393 RepID=A0A6J6EH48_9ZZZZ